MRFTIEFRNTFPSEMQQKYVAYAETVHPFTLDKEELYRHGWDDDEYAAMMLLLHSQNTSRSPPVGIICSGSWLLIRVYALAEKRSYLPRHPFIKMSIAHMSVPAHTFKDERIKDATLRGKLLAWVAESYRHRAVAEQVEKKLRFILDRTDGMNTPGQLYRVWPELASVMPERYRGKVVGQKLKSSLPSSWTEPDIAAFRSGEHFESINHAFMAMTVMDGLKRTQDYPVAF